MNSYHLYLWDWRWDEDQIGYQRFRRRGKFVASFSQFKALVAEAQRRTVAAGYPKSRWMDLFDWNKGSR